MYLLLLSYKEEKSSCPCEMFPGTLEKKGSLKSTVLVSLGWNTWSQLRLSLLAYCKVIKRGQKTKQNQKTKHVTIYSGLRCQKYQTIPLWDDNSSKGLSSRELENWNANEYEAKTPNIVALTVYYESSRLH